MKLKPKPIIKKSYKEVNQVSEKVSCVPTFPNLDRRPSAYKLLDKKLTQNEYKIQDLETITNLIKQLDRKEFDPIDTTSKRKIQKKSTHMERRFIKMPSGLTTTLQPLTNEMNTNTKESTNDIGAKASTPILAKRKSKFHYSKVITLPSGAGGNDYSSFELLDKDYYYSTLYTEKNYGKKIKTFSLPISDQEEIYNKKIKNLIFDNRILNHKEFNPLLQFNQMKQEHFKLFERMKYLKGTKSNAMKNKYTLKQYAKMKTIKENVGYVTLERPFVVPLDKIDEFKLLLINNYISEIDFKSNDEKKRKIFVIVDGTVIINSNFIPGFCIEMPTKTYLLKLSPEVRAKYYDNFLKICRGRCNSKCWFKNIVSYNLKLIIDLAEIEESDKFIFISSSNSYQGISIPLSNNIMKSYRDNYNQWKILQTDENNSSSDEYKEDANNDDVYEVYFNEKAKEGHETTRKFKKQSEIVKKKNHNNYNTDKCNQKLNISFTYGMSNDDNEDYFYFSDNEKRIKKTKEFIKKTLPTKGAFFIYIQNNIYDTKLKNLKMKFTENKSKTKDNLKTSNKIQSENTSQEYITQFLKKNKLFKHFIVPKEKGVLTTQELSDGISLLSQENPNLRLSRIFNQSKIGKYPIIQRNIDLNTNPYFDINKKTQTEYTHLLSYNIPKILSSNTHFTRKQLFSFFTQFKSLIALWLSFHQKIPISVYGIDFEMFKHCIPQLRNEDEKLLQKIFNQMNLSSSTLLSLDEFIEGMSMINRQQAKDKIDFFLEVFDKNHTGIFTYDEVKEICLVAIKRLLLDKQSQSICIDYLRDFLTDFIFEIVGCDKSKGLLIDKMKEMMINSKEKDLEYLEIFCCAKKLNIM